MLIITIILAVLCALLFYAVWKLFREREYDMNNADNPERLGMLVRAMTARVRREGNWDKLEYMRHEIRTALVEIDRLRHDRTEQGIRASKPQR